MSRDNADAVVIGAGHNGLVAAAMLAADGARGWPRRRLNRAVLALTVGSR